MGEGRDVEERKALKREKKKEEMSARKKILNDLSDYVSRKRTTTR
jgi:hypothetical protein